MRLDPSGVTLRVDAETPPPLSVVDGGGAAEADLLQEAREGEAGLDGVPRRPPNDRQPARCQGVAAREQHHESRGQHVSASVPVQASSFLLPGESSFEFASC